MTSGADLPTPRDPRGTGFRDRTEVSATVALLRERITPLPPESVPILEASGRVLAGAVTSPVDVPSFRRSSMDGFAVRAEDTYGANEYAPLELKVVGEVRPGDEPDVTVTPGTAVRVRTGAMIPAGANAVLRVEWTRDASAEPIEVTHPVSPAQDIGEVGEDITSGDELLPIGRVLRPQDLGVLSSVGIAKVDATCRPRVALFVTGREVLPAGTPPMGARIADANGPLVRALVERDTGRAPEIERLGDDLDETRDAIERAAKAFDAVIVTGGSSVGEEDFVPSAVRALGELPVHGIALRPASPTGIGFIGEVPIFLCPGNPVSCLCAYDLFAGPSIRALGGRPYSMPYRTRQLELTEKLTSLAGRVDYCRVHVDGDTARPLLVRGASRLSTTTRADGFVIVPPNLEGIAAGERVTVHLYDSNGGTVEP